MTLTKLRTTTPFHGRSTGGMNLRQLKDGSILRGTKSIVWNFQLPIHNLVLGNADLTSPTAGDIVLGVGFVSGGAAWTTAFPGTPCSLTIDKNSTSANTGLTVRLSGYDQFDRLVEEEISVAAADRTALSRYAYSEVIQCELVSEGSTAVSDFDVLVSGISDHSGFSPGLTGTAIPSCYIGLPFMADRYSLVQAVITGQTGASGYVRRLNTLNSDGVGLWSVQNESGSVTDSVVLLDTDVQNLGAGTMLLPGFSLTTGIQMGCLMFDPVVSKETI